MLFLLLLLLLLLLPHRHYLKRSVPALKKVRGTNLTHLMSMLFIYGLGVFISWHLQPVLTARIKQRKKKGRENIRKVGMRKA